MQAIQLSSLSLTSTSILSLHTHFSERRELRLERAIISDATRNLICLSSFHLRDFESPTGRISGAGLGMARYGMESRKSKSNGIYESSHRHRL